MITPSDKQFEQKRLTKGGGSRGTRGGECVLVGFV